MSWANSCLHIPHCGKIPVHVDGTSFMPLLTCFNNADEVIEKLENVCVSDEVNPLLTKQQKMLLKLHYKLGHVGFKRLIWMLKKFGLFGIKGAMAANADIPKCSS